MSWACPTCTFENDSMSTECEMCGTSSKSAAIPTMDNLAPGDPFASTFEALNKVRAQWLTENQIFFEVSSWFLCFIYVGCVALGAAYHLHILGYIRSR